MYWGAGPTLGLLTLFGYIIFTVGAAIFWRNRAQVYIWVQDEFGAVRRSFSRYTLVGPFYGPREESRLKTVPLQCWSSLSRFPRRHANVALPLLFAGVVLFLLDFFV
jgi:hypothetical protein